MRNQKNELPNTIIVVYLTQHYALMKGLSVTSDFIGLRDHSRKPSVATQETCVHVGRLARTLILFYFFAIGRGSRT